MMASSGISRATFGRTLSLSDAAFGRAEPVIPQNLPLHAHQQKRNNLPLLDPSRHQLTHKWGVLCRRPSVGGSFFQGRIPYDLKEAIEASYLRTPDGKALLTGMRDKYQSSSAYQQTFTSHRTNQKPTHTRLLPAVFGDKSQKTTVDTVRNDSSDGRTDRLLALDVPHFPTSCFVDDQINYHRIRLNSPFALGLY
ncbi:hypothetical protein T265_03799 [Opisthorchis viverrini]|uniref:Uncharacterized protein n=1 Tax=Opisthorchis viverrini TaxID=6198 RepID=A0A074ZQA6_OPIVI|nr:hypothetical protein T265_03799 [Opisthorchis viverrini]KER29598.1 hypothetical protein T265_03799 [Opisthorchis viverrini]